MSTYYKEKHNEDFPNFSDKELRCSCCNQFNDSPEFITLMRMVQKLRINLNFPMSVTSAYRCTKHPIEAKKSKGGQHTIAAIDLGVRGERAYDVLAEAFVMGFTGIGVNQIGGSRFIHLDIRQNPTVWSY